MLKDLLFFLHVPRTGGRTYFHCFLRKLYPNSQECPRSYDKLRFDPSKQKCRLLVTHDDYSMMSKLPKEKMSVVTILRNPVDRFFSTYEFSVEVAARFLVHPNLTSATQMAGRMRPRNGGVSTLDIWPWKYLVPWMREELFSWETGMVNALFNQDIRNFKDLNTCIRFKSEDRLHVPEAVLEQIRSLNDLDLELYKYAQGIFEKQHERMVQKLASTEEFKGLFSDGVTIWQIVSLVMSIGLLLVLFVLF